MTSIPADLDLVAVSAAAALLMGGAVRMFGSAWLFTALRLAGGAALRRRGASTILLGVTASAGLAVAHAVGL
jgi:hypothetical protein